MDDQHENSLDAWSFEWDENKRRTNIIKHSLDFRDVIDVFFQPYMDIALAYPKEPRRQATGMVGGRLVAVIYTLRGDAIRIISARRARDNEQRAYRALYDRGDP